MKKKYKKLLSKIRDLIKSTTNNSGDYDEKYRKIKFHSDDDMALNKTLKLHPIIMILLDLFFMKATNFISKFS